MMIRYVNFLWQWKLFRFLFNGGLGYVIYIALTYGLIEVVQWDYRLVLPFAFGVHFLVAIKLHKERTFIVDQVSPQQRVYYFVWFSSSLVIEYVLIVPAVQWLGINEMVAVVGAAVLLAIPSFFITRKIFSEQVT